MTVKTQKNDDGVIELDVSKIASLGAIPLLVIAVILFIQMVNTNKDNKELRGEIKVMNIKLDSVGVKVDRLTKLTCADSNQSKVIKLLDIRCL